jgi:hypothetical protein
LEFLKSSHRRTQNRLTFVSQFCLTEKGKGDNHFYHAKKLLRVSIAK